MSRPKRLSDASYIGFGAYFLTMCTRDRAVHFATAESVDLVQQQFLRTADDERFEIPAYCFMPDHVHLLLVGVTETANLKSFAKMSKQRSGYAFRQGFGARLWQDGYVDRMLRSDESILAVAFYIVANPVRAGLVANIGDYPFWGSGTMTRERLLQEIADVGAIGTGSRV